MVGNTKDLDKAPASSTSRLWPGLKNPRIVRMSRAFGGKDRHSKVTTVRGLRDRRVRLSVPTAIQLYDLQDRLGVNQPSKVVDWLLNAAHQEIEKLPPLQMLPQGNLEAAAPRAPSLPLATESFDKPTVDESLTTLIPQSTYCPSLVPMAPPQYSPYYHWEATNAYLSQFGVRSASQVEAVHDVSPMVLCQQAGVTPAVFPSFFPASADFDTKNSLHLGGPSARPFQ